MVSIVVSSYNQKYFGNLEANIAETCGVPYEIIRVPNNREFSICQAYNIGGSKAKYSNILFIHEDVKIFTKNWGQALSDILQNENIGVIGLSGSDYYATFPASWWFAPKIYTHIIQRHIDNTSTFHDKKNMTKSEEKVKGLDGVFLACRKSVFNEFKFDERINGFDGYDLIFTLKVAKKYTNVVSNQILIEHSSNGKISKNWIDNILKVKKIIGNFDDQKIDVSVEMQAIYGMILAFKNTNYPKIEAFYILFSNLSLRNLGFVNFLKVLNRSKHIL